MVVLVNMTEPPTALSVSRSETHASIMCFLFKVKVFFFLEVHVVVPDVIFQSFAKHSFWGGKVRNMILFLTEITGFLCTLNLSGSYQVSISSGLIAFNISIIGTEVYSKRSQDLLLSLVYLVL